MVSKRRTTLTSLPHDALLLVQPLTCTTKHWVVWDKRRKLKLDPYHSPLRHKVLRYLLVP